MKTIYQSSFGSHREDHDTVDAARAAVEEHGSGSIVQFVVEPNAPYCQPEHIYRSCAMWEFNGETWYRISIHTHECGRSPEIPA